MDSFDLEELYKQELMEVASGLFATYVHDVTFDLFNMNVLVRTIRESTSLCRMLAVLSNFYTTAKILWSYYVMGMSALSSIDSWVSDQ